mgnify:CR=1 FL=1
MSRMKETFVMALFAINGGIVMAGPVELKRQDEAEVPSIIGKQIPFDVDFNFDKLRIRLKNSNSLYVVVVGPQGVVYNKVINTTTPRSVYVDLEKYRDGDYSIYIQDAKGNNVSGEFYKENIPFNY